MKTILSRVRAAFVAAHAWLTDTRRIAIHGALGTLAALGVTVGWLSDLQSTSLLAASASVLVLAQGVFGLALLRRSDAAKWLGTVGRGLVYAAATAAGAAGVAFNMWGESDVAHVAGVIAAVTTVLSSFLSIANVQTVPALDGVPLTRREYRALLGED